MTIYSNGLEIKSIHYGAINISRVYNGNTLVWKEGPLLSLYIIASDRLYNVNVITGETDPIGRSSGFGVGETAARGLTQHKNDLWMVGETTDALIRVDRSTGVGVIVDPEVKNFGLSNPITPTSLATLNDILYMATESALYSVDETTGIATQIGTSGFGGIGFVRGIAGLNNKLYAVGIASGEEVFHIFELDTITGHIKSGTGKLFLPDFRTTNPIRRPVGLSSNGSNLILIDDNTTGLFELDVVSETVTQLGIQDLQNRDAIAYFIRAQFVPKPLNPVGRVYFFGSGIRALFTLDIVTGRATRVGNAVNFGVDSRYSSSEPRALGSTNSKLYGLFGGGSSRNIPAALYEFNLVTGAATRIGNATDFGIDFQFPSGMTYHDDKMYVCSNNDLFTIDLSTGILTKVNTVTKWGGIDFPLVQSIASSNNTLFGADVNGGILYSIDTSDGSATTVGRFLNSTGTSLTFTNMTSVDGVLYGLDSAEHRLYSIDQTTAACTQISDPSGSGVGEGNPAGMTTIIL